MVYFEPAPSAGLRAVDVCMMSPDTIDPQRLSCNPSFAPTHSPETSSPSQQFTEVQLSQITDDLENLIPLIEWCNENPLPASTGMTESEPGRFAVQQPPSRACTTLDNVTVMLGAELQTRVSATRMSHLSILLEIPPTTELEVRLSAAQNKAMQQSLVDREMSWTQIPARRDGRATIRTMSVYDITANHAQDRTLCDIVAKRIMGAVSRADGATWLVGDPSYTSEGWKHEYTCKESYATWKKTSKPFNQLQIAECSSKKPRGAAAARPAFDCRGSIVILFSQHTRSILVQYSHTPVHITVGEVYQQLEPRSALHQSMSVLDVHLNSVRAKSTPKARRKQNATNPSGSQVDQHPKTDQPLIPAPSYQFAVAAEPTPPTEPTYSNQDTQAVDPNLTVALADQESQTNTMATATVNAPQNNPGAGTVHGTPVAVSPEEAQRRKTVANERLETNGIDPATLSVQQFDIFSNQAPSVQDASLAMLLKYGAEKLRIVQQKPSPKPPQVASPTTIAKSSPQTKSSPASGGTSPKKMGMSRLACFVCKKRAIGCSKERPNCKNCTISGLSCEYPPVKPRNRKKSQTEKTANQQKAATPRDQGPQPTETPIQTPESQNTSTMPIESPVPQMPPSRLPDWYLSGVAIKTTPATASGKNTLAEQQVYLQNLNSSHLQQQQMHVTPQKYRAKTKKEARDSAAMHQRTPQTLPIDQQGLDFNSARPFGDTSAQEGIMVEQPSGQDINHMSLDQNYSFSSGSWDNWLQESSTSMAEEPISYEPYLDEMAPSNQNWLQ